MKQGSIGTRKKVGELLGYRNGEDGGGELIAYLSPCCPHQVFSASRAALSSVRGLV